MKLVEIAEPRAKSPNDEKKFVVIGNPGRSQPSSLYPKTIAPKMYTLKAAQKIADKLNAPALKMTYGTTPSSVHWHVKHVTDAVNYVAGTSAHTSIRMLNPPDDAGWGHGPAKHRF